ncbi:MAG: hypothetical protein ACI4VW_03975 [Acutalibacteraceae bacterium]
MSKKIIAILTVATILFVCVFAACEKEPSAYIGNDDFEYVTDENGERVLGEDGQFVVYATDEKGKIIENENGEKVTQLQQFQPIEEDGVIEDYGFKLALPEGWKTTSEFGVFENEKGKINCQISIVKYFYNDYYDLNKSTCDQIAEGGLDTEWEENLDFGDEYEGLCRFKIKSEDGMSILYFFENSGNVYKLLFASTDVENAVAKSEEMCKAMSFKPYTYYDDITAKETTTEK